MKTLLRIAAIALAITSCSSTSDAKDPTDTNTAFNYVGVYKLNDANLNALPATIEETATYKLEAVSGELSMNKNFTFNWTVRFKLTLNGSATTREWKASGTYTVQSFFDEPAIHMSNPFDTFDLDVDRRSIDGAVYVPSSVVTDSRGEDVLILLGWRK